MPYLTIWPTAPDGGGSAPEGGTATENPELRPGGLTITGFIDRLGDPVPITAPDGGAHRRIPDRGRDQVDRTRGHRRIPHGLNGCRGLSRMVAR